MYCKGLLSVFCSTIIHACKLAQCCAFSIWELNPNNESLRSESNWANASAALQRKNRKHNFEGVSCSNCHKGLPAASLTQKCCTAPCMCKPYVCIHIITNVETDLWKGYKSVIWHCCTEAPLQLEELQYITSGKVWRNAETDCRLLRIIKHRVQACLYPKITSEQHSVAALPAVQGLCNQTLASKAQAKSRTYPGARL